MPGGLSSEKDGTRNDEAAGVNRSCAETFTGIDGDEDLAEPTDLAIVQEAFRKVLSGGMFGEATKGGR
ncbi:hypothetical protein F0562_002945 [Nyssa sinensis]|uniref:Uncharacterized protein n=1 Tax=Nyssa sinensis TaxID=561372 RepID=A0A5J5BX89_9ASTE|nr:hypothetical protein F0562_002945 [Nyssa sinensis]